MDERAIVERAREAAQFFERAERLMDGAQFTRTTDDAPAWVDELVKCAHDDGEILPDDWRYEAIHAALDAIADAEDDGDLGPVGDQFADDCVDVYTSERLAWLGSHARRIGYADDGAAELNPEADTLERIGLGQYVEAREVFASVVSFLSRGA